MTGRCVMLAAAMALAVSGCATMPEFGGRAGIASAASRHIGSNPTGQRYLWCQDFVNLAVTQAGYRGTGSRQARSVLRWGQAVPKRSASAGDIVLYPRRGGGHTEVFSEWIDRAAGTFRAIAGNTCGTPGRKSVCVIERSMSQAIAVRRAPR